MLNIRAAGRSFQTARKRDINIDQGAIKIESTPPGSRSLFRTYNEKAGCTRTVFLHRFPRSRRKEEKRGHFLFLTRTFSRTRQLSRKRVRKLQLVNSFRCFPWRAPACCLPGPRRRSSSRGANSSLVTKDKARGGRKTVAGGLLARGISILIPPRGRSNFHRARDAERMRNSGIPSVSGAPRLPLE